MRKCVSLAVLLSLAFAAFSVPASAQERDPLAVRSVNRLRSYIDDEHRVVIRGNRHPLARPEFDAGAARPDLPMERMILTLSPSAEQGAALSALIEAQHDPTSPLYQRWLSPEEFGQRFGASDGDIAVISNWLQMQGLQVEEITTGRRSIVFSGTAAQVQEAFRTEIRQYNVGGELHYANATDPEIPAALASVVGGVVSLHNFQSKPLHIRFDADSQRPSAKPKPQYTSGTSHYLTPTDFATIYNISPLYSKGFDGTGQAVAVVARSNINLSDVRQFRTAYGLPANDPQIILTGADPGTADRGELVEATLDTEWIGAVAKKATTKVVVSKSTSTSDGIYLSAQYVINNNVAPIMTVSFGLCESLLGSSGNSFMNGLWQQAAAQGISVFVASGDSGAAGCDYSSSTYASRGRGVNGMCSTPYSTCVGGTQFADTSSASQYWSGTNSTGTLASALSYIPETAWNESGSSGLWATGGGVSTIYKKPSWQSATGVPADGMRDVPDVSLTAAGHDGYLIYVGGSQSAVGGTSAATPALAGIMALVNQSNGKAQGLANPFFYSMARSQQSGGAAVFHDTTTGNNSVPGVTGYTAGANYDLATGLGSVDASQLVANWNGPSSGGTSGGSTPTDSKTFQLASSSNTLTISTGGSASVIATVSVSGGFSSSVALGVTGLPAGLTATLSPTSFAAPGSGTSTVKFAAFSTMKIGSYTVNLTATSGGVVKTVPLTVIVSAPASFAISSSASTLTISPGTSQSITVTSTTSGAWSTAVALTVTGLPTGMSASFSPNQIAAPGAGSSTLRVVASTTVTPGKYSLTVTGTSSGKVISVPLTIKVPGFSLNGSTSTLSITRGSTNKLTLSTASLGDFNSTITFSASGLPAGVTVAFAPSYVAAPGSGSVTATVVTSNSALAGASSVTLTASGGGFTKSWPITLSINIPSTFVLNVVPLSLTNSNVLGLKIGTTPLYGFTSDVAFTVSGIPSGATAAFAPTKVKVGSATNFTLTLTPKVSAGTYTLRLNATGGAVTQTITLQITLGISPNSKPAAMTNGSAFAPGFIITAPEMPEKADDKKTKQDGDEVEPAKLKRLNR